jgi:X-Pro dipeptidyl-peptidase
MRRAPVVLVTVLSAAVALSSWTPATTAASRTAVVAGESRPVHSLADAITETVRVESGVDSDADGAPDLISVDVMRPRATESGLTVPVVMEASPYYALSAAQLAMEGTVPRGFARWYDEFFVPRGYAVVEVEMQGTSRSQGCPTSGGPEDTASITAVVDWLGGRARAVHEDGTPAVASWSTGNVGMIGVSYNGTLPVALASAGVEGLKTIVPIAAISSWYDYARDRGIGYAGWDDRYPEFLANYVISAEASTRCAAVVTALGDAAADDTFDRTPFWQERDHRRTADRITASVFVAHGQTDRNVKPAQFSRLWEELRARDVPRKLWLHRGGHLDPLSIRAPEWQRAVHHWMDHWLLGLDNGITEEPVVDLQRADGTWTTEAEWPRPGAAPVVLRPARDGVLGVEPGSGQVSATDDPALTEPDVLAGLEGAGAAGADRLVWLTAPLTADAAISGTPVVDVRVSSTSASTPLTALLVDRGPAEVTTPVERTPLELLSASCRQVDVERRTGCAAPPVERTEAVTAQVIARGSVDVKNHASLENGEALEPGRSYDVRWELQPQDHVVPAGHQIGLVLVQNLADRVAVDPAARDVAVDLSATSVAVPVVGGQVPLGP